LVASIAVQLFVRQTAMNSIPRESLSESAVLLGKVSARWQVIDHSSALHCSQPIHG
jgi:hypothetical protein